MGGGTAVHIVYCSSGWWRWMVRFAVGHGSVWTAGVVWILTKTIVGFCQGLEPWSSG